MFCFIKSILHSICVIYILANVVGAASTNNKKPIRRSRIVGGQETTIDKAPYIVQIRDKDGDTYCGGTLIAPKYVLTAAHCVDGIEAVVGGASTTSDSGVQSRVTKKPIVHPAYRTTAPHSDIAVVELDTELKGANIATVSLCKKAVKEGDYIQTYGWGLIKNKPMTDTKKLHTVRLPVRSYNHCDDEFANIGYNIFCASGRERKGICDGDSGGPAILKGELCGVNAFTSACGEEFDLSGFVSIPAVRDFIDKAMGINALKK